MGTERLKSGLNLNQELASAIANLNILGILNPRLCESNLCLTKSN
ncbi:hypothetical protein SPLC1_S206070 [Arthrospira platensis C1]|uniref:Uncharacterized protein n=1 Tax=Limnospira indica PCC 8005 TaxID=376219 RepID=A0A9P1KIQ9_9CYAN|nr:hypothetical protein SPLC1_S206070 [Arthrospira platensis C1]CDM97876.1 conserved protein of unknown function [Limnospira indica PCC 8005]